MKIRSGRPAVAVAVLAVIASIAPVTAASPRSGPLEVTGTERGHALAEQGAARHRALGVPSKAASLRVWRTTDGGYLVGTRLPDNLRTSIEERADGTVIAEMSYDVGGLDEGGAKTASLDGRLAAGPSWQWRSQGCFSRLGGSSGPGWLDSCYAIHKLVNETNSRDYYKLEQWGTLAAANLGKIYNGWLAATRAASGSSTMRWADWSPRGSTSGSCVNVTLSIAALGVGFSSPAFFCEQNIPHKSPTPGSFRMEWSCGCIWPFGQPVPNSREIDYLQAVSVPNGGAARWTLSAGLHAR
jgi:hypothetical protein